QCGACDRMLCPDCAALRRTNAQAYAHHAAAEAGDSLNANILVLCVHCGGVARTLTRRRDIPKFYERRGYTAFLNTMFSNSGVLQVAAVGIMMYLVGLLPGNLGLGLSRFVFVSYFFHVIHRTAHGETALPWPADFLGAESFIVVTRYSFGTLLVLGPALVYTLWGISLWELTHNVEHVIQTRIFDPFPLTMLILGAVYYPAAIIAGAVAESVLAMINPLITIRLILRIPAQYAITVATWAALTIADFLWTLGVDAAVAAIPIAFIPKLVGVILTLPLRLTVGWMLGRLVFQNAEEFGIVREELLVEPALPGVAPRGEVSRSP
ncbi:MAG: hypothetical protein RL846_39075, partial [Deltaproteobacteria bacterium]